MKTVNLKQEKLELDKLIGMARKEPVLVLTAGGDEFILSKADDFDKEVEALRDSQSFQKFLEERSQCKARIPLSEIEREINEELSKKKETA